VAGRFWSVLGDYCAGSGRRGLGWGGWRLPSPFGCLPLDMPLDWVLDGDEGKDSSLAILDAIEDDFLRKVKVACLKTKGWRELRNL
jgi:hypothetical protein